MRVCIPEQSLSHRQITVRATPKSIFVAANQLLHMACIFLLTSFTPLDCPQSRECFKLIYLSVCMSLQTHLALHNMQGLAQSLLITRMISRCVPVTYCSHYAHLMILAWSSPLPKQYSCQMSLPIFHTIHE